MASDFEQYGVSAIRRVRSRYPAIYLKICAMMLPKEIQVKEDAISRLSDEQLDEYLQIVKTTSHRRKVLYSAACGCCAIARAIARRAGITPNSACSTHHHARVGFQVALRGASCDRTDGLDVRLRRHSGSVLERPRARLTHKRRRPN